MYSTMAHYVAETLHLRPASILDTWSVPELLVAFGQYANEVADSNYKQWQNMDVQSRTKKERPPRYIVQFMGLEELEDG